MELHRLKVKIGDCEFEGEGSEKHVKELFDQFAKLVGGQKATQTARPPHHGANTASNGTAPPRSKENQPDNPLARLFRTEGDKLVLAVRPKNVGDAMLVILQGYKELKNSESVLVSPLLQGLKPSGFTVDRMDEVTPTLTPDNGAMIMKTGQRNASKYRLTAIGAQRAEELTKELLAMLP